MDYYIEIKGEVRGPYALSQLRSMWDNGVVTSDARYREGSAGEWRPVAQLMTPGDPVTELLRIDPAPEASPGLQRLYLASIAVGVLIAVYIYLIAFDSFSETVLVRITPVWLFPIVFGYYGFVALRLAVRREKSHLETVADAFLEVLRGMTGVFGRFFMVVVHAPFLVVRSRDPLLTALLGSLIWAVALLIFFEAVFPHL